jgi:hypothetical protein
MHALLILVEIILDNSDTLSAPQILIKQLLDGIHIGAKPKTDHAQVITSREEITSFEGTRPLHFADNWDAKFLKAKFHDGDLTGAGKRRIIRHKGCFCCLSTIVELQLRYEPNFGARTGHNDSSGGCDLLISAKNKIRKWLAIRK